MKLRYLLILILLSGCSSYRSKFDCKPNGNGVGCERMSDVADLESHGKLDAFISQKNGGKQTKRVTIYDYAPSKYSQKVLIYFNGYIDEDNVERLAHSVKITL